MGTVVGALGTGLLVLAFMLNLTGRLEISWVYTVLNLVGAGLAATAAYLIKFPPFVILESVWFAAALMKLVSLLGSERGANER